MEVLLTTCDRKLSEIEGNISAEIKDFQNYYG